MFLRAGAIRSAPLFLSTLILLAASLPAGAAPASKEARKSMDKLGWRLSCQAYTFRAKTLYDTIETVKKLGIRYLEMYPGQELSRDHPGVHFDHNLPPALVKEVSDRLKGAGITPVCYGVVGLSADEAEARRVFEFARALNLYAIVSEPPEDAMPMLDRLCGEYKINLAIHNHPQPSHYWNPATVLKVTNGLSPRVGACADTGHWYRSGITPVDGLKMLQGRIISLHLKDLSPQKTDVPWGTGVCDMEDILAELKRQGVKAVFSIEYESTTGDELYANVEKCVDYFHTATARLAAAK